MGFLLGCLLEIGYLLTRHMEAGRFRTLKIAYTQVGQQQAQQYSFSGLNKPGRSTCHKHRFTWVLTFHFITVYFVKTNENTPPPPHPHSRNHRRFGRKVAKSTLVTAAPSFFHINPILYSNMHDISLMVATETG